MQQVLLPRRSTFLRMTIWFTNLLSVAYICFTVIPFYTYGIYRYTQEEIYTQAFNTSYFSTIFSFFGLFSTLLLPVYGALSAITVAIYGAFRWHYMQKMERIAVIITIILFLCTITFYFSPIAHLINIWILD